MGEHTHPLQLSAWIPALIWAVISGSAALGQLWLGWLAEKRARAAASAPSTNPQTAHAMALLAAATSLGETATALRETAAALNGAAAASTSAAEKTQLLDAALAATTAAFAALSAALSVVPVSAATATSNDLPHAPTAPTASPSAAPNDAPALTIPEINVRCDLGMGSLLDYPQTPQNPTPTHQPTGPSLPSLTPPGGNPSATLPPRQAAGQIRQRRKSQKSE
ncbi:MAG: hypothetical protein M1813_002924 [Trichoglossum hirsutum]|nr:MAG: hypothetical protein M1813_002924 [Trichoglossum hirsutum]